MQTKKRVDSLKPAEPASRRVGKGNGESYIIVKSQGKDMKIGDINTLRTAA